MRSGGQKLLKLNEDCFKVRLGICTIQRNRAPWIVEWIAFHYLMGFRHFYFFAHRCTDATYQILTHLQRRIEIKAFILGDDTPRPQLSAFQYAYDNFSDEVDWMAFIDGDEFLFPTKSTDVAHALRDIDDGFMSALGVYWSCYGSNHFLIEPTGLITENYRHRAADNFDRNAHIKSIVRGGLGSSVSVSSNSHIFITPNGTFDENRQLITSGYTNSTPTWNHLRINHYICQSRNYFESFKQTSGAADAGSNVVRSEDWWQDHDKNDIYDRSLERFYSDLKKLMMDLCQ